FSTWTPFGGTITESALKYKSRLGGVFGNNVLDTELLQICLEIEKGLEPGNEESEQGQYQETLWYETNPGIKFLEEEIIDVYYLQKFITATWHHRTIALAKVKQ